MLPRFRQLSFLVASVASCKVKSAGADYAGTSGNQLPKLATHVVDFSKEIKPIFEASCIKCHGRGKTKAGSSSRIAQPRSRAATPVR